ncbi:MAG: cell division protein FtsQ/DivIB [Terriglobales bacterium]
MARDEVHFPREGRSLAPARSASARGGVEELFDDDLPPALDLEIEEESPFLRGQKRVPVRRGPLPRKTAVRLKQGFLLLLAFAVLGAAGMLLYGYGTGSWRFRLDSKENIEIAGVENVAPAQVLELFRNDLGRNLFSVPLEQRKKALEEIPWVEEATVMRLLPDRIRVQVRERTPVAFVRIGSKISLIDPNGAVMEPPTGRQAGYSFPVIMGMSESDPLTVRAARMKIYAGLIRELDSEGPAYSHDLSEVDLSDPEDVKTTVADPAGAVLVHLGSAHFLKRYKVYLAHVAEWRQQFQKLESVDLRYDRQIIVNPDLKGVRSDASEKRPTPSATRPKTGTRKARR